MSAIFDPPRWPGGPQICSASNRMAFPTAQAIADYRRSIGMSGYDSGAIWQCRSCKQWHYEGTAPDPSGASSGTSRHQRHARRN